MSTFHDGDDDDKKKKKQSSDAQPGPDAGDYNHGDAIGTKIGQGHDTVEDPVT